MRLSRQYIAGFIDGEGCIRFGHNRTTLFPMVVVTHTNREILEELQRRFGGDIHSHRHKEHWKTSHFWRIGWSRAVDFLDKISPYLNLKSDQANAVFCWNEIRPNRGKKWDKDALTLLLDEMTWLNKKGSLDKGIEPIQSVLDEMKNETQQA